MLESLMCLEVMNDVTGTVGQPNKQVWALGVANTLAGLFGTMGGNSLIELSVMNVQAGGTLRASATLVSLGVLLVIVVMDTAKWSSLPAMLAAFLPESVLGEKAPDH